MLGLSQPPRDTTIAHILDRKKLVKFRELCWQIPLRLTPYINSWLKMNVFPNQAPVLPGATKCPALKDYGV
jgi:hypothetical protein